MLNSFYSLSIVLNSIPQNLVDCFWIQSSLPVQWFCSTFRSWYAPKSTDIRLFVDMSWSSTEILCFYHICYVESLLGVKHYIVQNSSLCIYLFLKCLIINDQPRRDTSITMPMNWVKSTKGVKKDQTGHKEMLKQIVAAIKLAVVMGISAG